METRTEDKFSHRYGRALSKQAKSSKILTRRSNWGAKQMRKTMQSKYEIWPRIMMLPSTPRDHRATTGQIAKKLKLNIESEEKQYGWKSSCVNTQK